MKSNAFNILKEGCSLMEDYWLASGTMLGLYRERDFIEWDTDLDVETTQPVDVNLFIANGFHLHRIMDSDRVYQHAFIKDDVIFDIYYFYRENDELINYNDFGVAVQPYDLFFPRGKFEWRGVEWNVPNDIEKYLIFRYGEDWKTPKPKVAWGQQANHLR